MLVDPTDEAATQQFGVPFRVGEKIVIAVEWVLARVGLLERFFRFLGEGMPEDVRADLHREAFQPAVVVTQGRQARTFLTELHAWRGDPPVLPDVPVTAISGSLADGMPRPPPGGIGPHGPGRAGTWSLPAPATTSPPQNRT